MAKGQDAKKAVKKEPLKTAKEKKEEKREKKAKRDQSEIRIEYFYLKKSFNFCFVLISSLILKCFRKETYNKNYSKNEKYTQRLSGVIGFDDNHHELRADKSS